MQCYSIDLCFLVSRNWSSSYHGFISNKLQRLKASSFYKMNSAHSYNATDTNLSVDSRKRKAHILDQQHDSEPNFGEGGNQGNSTHFMLPVLNSHHIVGTFSGINVQVRTPRSLSNQNFKSKESLKEESQFGNFNLNNHLSTSQKDDGNCQRTVVEKMNNACGSSQFSRNLSDNSSLSSLAKRPVSEIQVLHVLHDEGYNASSQNKGNKLQPHAGGHNASEENLSGANFKKGIAPTGNSLQELFGLPLDTFESFEVSQLGIIKDQKLGHCRNEDRRNGVQGSHSIGSSAKSDENCRSSDARIRDISNSEIGHSKSSTCSDNKEVYKSNQITEADVSSGKFQDTGSGFNVICGKNDQICSPDSQMLTREKSPCDGSCSEDGEVDKCVEFSTNVGVRTTKKPGESDRENGSHLKNKISSGVTSNGVKNLERHGDPSFLKNLNEKGVVQSGKVDSKKIQKLWDGLLQLNASTTVSAVAFFKSGERSLEVSWSKLVEVKGKVRLEAFEKYIQELPRSRSRALMVISLCWKVGSSQTGLKGMKEIAEGYIKGEKVGFAQPTPGIDLYICPRSEAIITILAKYGFYKGMAAVEDNQDSMIGCIVWRKSRTSSHPLSKNSEKMKVILEQQSDSPSDSSILRTEESSSPHITVMALEKKSTQSSTIQPAGSSTKLVSDMRPQGPASETENTSFRIKEKQASKDQVKEDNFPVTVTASKPALWVCSNSPFISTTPMSALKPHSDLLPETMKCFLKSELARMDVLKSKMLGACLEFSESVFGGPLQTSTTPQQTLASSDDDDLPEFDFSSACGIPKGPVTRPPFHINQSPLLDKQITIEGIGQVMLPAVRIARPVAVSSDKKSEAPTYIERAKDSHKGFPLSRKQGECDSLVSVLPIAQEKPATIPGQRVNRPIAGKLENKDAATIESSHHFLQKNFWDDDDDMPEWCPPVMENSVQLAAADTNAPSNPTHFSKPTSENVAPLCTLHPNLMPMHPPFPQGLPTGSNRGILGQHPVSNTGMPPQTRPIVGSGQFGHPRGSNPNCHMRPQPPLCDIKFSIKPTGWRASKH